MMTGLVEKMTGTATIMVVLTMEATEKAPEQAQMSPEQIQAIQEKGRTVQELELVQMGPAMVKWK